MSPTDAAGLRIGAVMTRIGECRGEKVHCELSYVRRLATGKDMYGRRPIHTGPVSCLSSCDIR